MKETRELQRVQLRWLRTALSFITWAVLCKRFRGFWTFNSSIYSVEENDLTSSSAIDPATSEGRDSFLRGSSFKAAEYKWDNDKINGGATIHQFSSRWREASEWEWSEKHRKRENESPERYTSKNERVRTSLFSNQNRGISSLQSPSQCITHKWGQFTDLTNRKPKNE